MALPVENSDRQPSQDITALKLKIHICVVFLMVIRNTGFHFFYEKARGASRKEFTQVPFVSYHCPKSTGHTGQDARDSEERATLGGN